MPFDGENPVVVAMQHIQDAPIPPHQCNPSIPAALEEILLRCLEKAPEKRFRDGSQLARAFARLGDAKLGESVPVTAGQAATPAIAHNIPSRPGTNGRDGTLENVPPGAPASSPDNRMGPGIPSDQRHARFASMITLLMLLAILFLLGFSAFLVARPGFIPFPSFSGQTAGLVVGQNPKAHEKAAKDSTLEVRMELLTTTQKR